MDGYYENIDTQVLKNKQRHVEVYSDKNMSLVFVCLKPKEEIGMEIHDHETQFTKVVKGVGLAIVGEKTQVLNNGMVTVIPVGSKHNIINVSDTEPLKMYTIYSGRKTIQFE